MTHSSFVESICHQLWSGRDRTLLERSAGQRPCSGWRLQGCGFFQALAQTAPRPIPGSPFHTLPFLLLRPHLSADSWASFIEAQNEALVWG